MPVIHTRNKDGIVPEVARQLSIWQILLLELANLDQTRDLLPVVKAFNLVDIDCEEDVLAHLPNPVRLMIGVDYAFTTFKATHIWLESLVTSLDLLCSQCLNLCPLVGRLVRVVHCVLPSV